MQTNPPRASQHSSGPSPAAKHPPTTSNDSSRSTPEIGATSNPHEDLNRSVLTLLSKGKQRARLLNPQLIENVIDRNEASENSQLIRNSDLLIHNIRNIC